MLVQIKSYNATLGTFVLQSCPVYANDAAALYAIDPPLGVKLFLPVLPMHKLIPTTMALQDSYT
jgi:hypothetical protein